jgi:hypothetical protein
MVTSSNLAALKLCNTVIFFTCSTLSIVIQVYAGTHCAVLRPVRCRRSLASTLGGIQSPTRAGSSVHKGNMLMRRAVCGNTQNDVRRVRLSLQYVNSIGSQHIFMRLMGRPCTVYCVSGAGNWPFQSIPARRWWRADIQSIPIIRTTPAILYIAFSDCCLLNRICSVYRHGLAFRAKHRCCRSRSGAPCRPTTTRLRPTSAVGCVPA